jgi:hypothetical protein
LDSHQLLAISHQLSAISHQLSAASFQPGVWGSIRQNLVGVMAMGRPSEQKNWEQQTEQSETGINCLAQG